MTRPSLCIVIPVYNCARLVRATLDSVVTQPFVPNKLVVVDDGSTDGSLAVVDRWLDERRPAIPLLAIRQSNRGCPAARNRGAELAGDCELLMFLDADDLLAPDLLWQACAALTSDRRRVAAFRDSEFVWADGGQRDLNDARLFATDPVRHMMTTWVPPVPSATVVRAASHFQIGGFNEAMSCHEDTDYMLRLSLVGPLVWLPGKPVSIRRVCTKTEFANGASAARHNSSRALTPLGRFTLAVVWSRHLKRMATGDRLSPECRRFLRRRWTSAAKAFLKEGRRREAVWCFDRAIEVSPYDVRIRWHRFSSLPMGHGRSPDARLGIAA